MTRIDQRRALWSAICCIFLAFGALAIATPEAPAVPEPTAAEDPVVLRVGDVSLLRSEVEERFEIAMRSLAAQQGMPFSPEIAEMFAEFRPQFLEQRATELVLVQEAERRGIQVTDEELDAQLEQIRAGFPTQEAFEEVLQEAGFGSEAELREIIRETELVQRTVQAIGEGIEIADEDVAAWYAANVEQLTQPEQVCARHILVETVEEAQDLLAQIEGGAEFEELAAEHSIDPGSGARGGDLGCFPRGMMVPPFEEAAFAAEEGDVVGPVESQFGFHLITVYDRQDAEVAELDEVRPQIVQQLQQERLGDEIDALRDGADVEIHPERFVATPGAVQPEVEGEGTTDPTDADVDMDTETDAGTDVDTDVDEDESDTDD